VEKIANEFFDLFNQLFLSVGVWGLIGVSLVIIASLLFAKTIKYSYIFLIPLQALMAIEYLTLGSSYFWHIILLVTGSIVTLLVGLKK